ncbi:hypothetical protein GCM10007377_15620 [Galliscardovia ingluviei]|uniref:Uncharacterized protein n=1 Tax=Galliscardovia ingluviei TaxID=1769422 RepID=A0A8J3EZK5_9BIFI|nr:hypothetical protein [Galliscardovia ingluviei]GGI15382.1 hypothetical protein GCM10007377_15620 [Galliscardovia ingluviei]
MLVFEYPFNPNSARLWEYGSDVDWIKGHMVFENNHYKRFTRMHPWLVGSLQQAKDMAVRQLDAVRAILGALSSWRVATTSQLEAGLAVKPIPRFTRDTPNLYGALCRLGLINVGFNPSERIDGTPSELTFVSLGTDAKLIRQQVRVLFPKWWQRSPIYDSAGGLGAKRVFARHNVYAAHAGLAFAHHEHIQFTGGDGWGGFARIDPVAVKDAQLSMSTAADVVALTDAGVMAAVEVQSHTVKVDTKLDNWLAMLAHSPMSRRGLLNIWLIVPAPKGLQLQYANYTTQISHAQANPLATTGSPLTGERVGFASWDDWFDSEGYPTSRFGCYMSLLAHEQSMFDPKWRELTPSVQPLRLDHWGQDVVAESIQQFYGWDISSWTVPEALEGGFYGLVNGGAGCQA